MSTTVKQPECGPDVACNLSRVLHEAGYVPSEPAHWETLLNAAHEWRVSLDAIAEELCLVDLDGRIMRCNRAMMTRLDRPYSEIVGKPCAGLVCPASRCAKDCSMEPLRKSRVRQEREFVHDGRWCHMTADPVSDDSGRLTGVVLLRTDITAQRRAEERLEAYQRSGLLHRMLMDSIPSSVLLLSFDLRVVVANRTFLEKSLRKEGETVGLPLGRVFPDAILQEVGLEAQIRAVFRENRAKQGQRLTYRAPGVPARIYYYSLVPVSWGSTVDHVLLIMHDVTEQTRMSEEIRRMERHMASVVESASDIVLSTDPKLTVLTWNRAAERISGYASGEIKGRPLFDFLDPAFRASGRALFATGSGPRAFECDLITRDGKRCVISWNFSEMTDGAGHVAGFVGVGRDLTERRKYEAELAQSQKLAALGVMAGGIAHEIRTPLAISSSAAQFLMEEDVTPEFRREWAGKVDAGIRRASVIIENLLRFARPSARLDRVQVDLPGVVRGPVSLIAHQAKLQNIEIVTRFPEEPCVMLGVPGLLEQVFLNLFLNAIRAMPRGGVLEVSIEKVEGQVKATVTDTGHGIAPEDLGNIFDPFFTRAEPGKGTGLGLSICYSIVKQHMGSIEATSEPGNGSQFVITMPLL